MAGQRDVPPVQAMRSQAHKAGAHVHGLMERPLAARAGRNMLAAKAGTGDREPGAGERKGNVWVGRGKRRWNVVDLVALTNLRILSPFLPLFPLPYSPWPCENKMAGTDLR